MARKGKHHTKQTKRQESFLPENQHIQSIWLSGLGLFVGWMFLTPITLMIYIKDKDHICMCLVIFLNENQGCVHFCLSFAKSLLMNTSN